LGKERVGGGELLLSVVGGLQGFLEERAKAEAVDYTVDQLRDRLCTDEFAKYAVQTCQLLKSDQLNLDEATLVRLKQALLADLGQLAARVVSQLPPTKDPRQLALRLFAQSGVETAMDLSFGRVPLHEISSTWASKDQSAYTNAKLDLQCSMLETRMPSACWVLLVPELGKTAVELKPELKPEDIAAVIERAAQGFCATYGAEKQKENGSCLLGEKSQLEDLNSDGSSDMRSLVAASLRFVQLATQADKLAKGGTPFSEIVTRMLPDVAVAFDAWNVALQKALSKSPDDDKNTRATVAFVLRASSAAASRNYPMLLAVLAEAFEPGQPLAEVKLPPNVMTSLGFAARLAAAQKSEDAKKVFEEEAAPLGSYKVKYGRGSVTITINAFVGPFVGTGWQHQVKVPNSDSHVGFVTRPLSAPIGVDFTLMSARHAHFGVMLAVVDPFAVATVSSDAKAEDFDWGALLTPGAMARLGIGGSPFTVLGGFTWQPLARSAETCAQNGVSVPCWKGALQVGGAIAVDVPLAVLR
jgi:hypothetical protein